MRQEELYNVSKKALEEKESLVPVGDDPELGCAISLTVLLNRIGCIIKETASTAELLMELAEDPEFEEISETDAGCGDIIICATGTSSIPNTPIPHGHCGIVGKFGIMSNDSRNGIWSEYYTLESWKERYEIKGGYASRFFRIVEI
jgi:hypothetical protein